MPRRSNIVRLKPALREALEAWIREGELTQEEIAAEVNRLAGATVVSKSGVNRYSIKMEAYGEKIRQARAVADMWMARLGDDSNNQMGKLLNEQLRTLAFDLTISGELDDDNMDIKDKVELLRDIANTLKNLELAASTNQERERKLRAQISEEKAKAVGAEAKAQGLSAEGIAKLRAVVLGQSDG